MVWFFVSALLLLACIFSLTKIINMKKSINTICEEMREKLDGDTNTAITVNSSDSSIKKLASEINHELTDLRKEKLNLQNGNYELTNAMTNISHDLRTPLTAIGGYIELLDNENLSPKADEYLSVIKERTETLCNLTEELFKFSVISSTAQEIDREEVNVISVLEESLAGFYKLLSEHNITPSLNIPDEPKYKLIDRKSLRRIFDNLISNAVKYSDGDLSITILDNGKIIFSNSASSLDSVSVGRLFDRFYTLETGRSSTGLGLSIAKLLTEQMGGTIKATYTGNILSISLEL